MKKALCTQRGFTLLELVGVLAVSTVLASYSIPMAIDIKNSAVGAGVQEDLALSLNAARQHAVSTGQKTSVCASSDGITCEHGQWSAGWLVYQGGEVEDGSVVLEANRIESYTVLNEDLEIELHDEKLDQVFSVSFNERGFNALNLKVASEVCSAESHLAAESVFIDRSGRIRVQLREELDTKLKHKCR
jgi:type IV fimbrial biogenesis protein FimT